MMTDGAGWTRMFSSFRAAYRLLYNKHGLAIATRRHTKRVVPSRDKAEFAPEPNPPVLDLGLAGSVVVVAFVVVPTSRASFLNEGSWNAAKEPQRPERAAGGTKHRT